MKWIYISDVNDGDGVYVNHRRAVVYANPSSSSTPQDFHTDLDEEDDEKFHQRHIATNNFKSTQSTEGKLGADKDRACVEYLRWEGDLEEIL